MVTLMFMVFFASSTDVMANFFDLPLKAVLWFFRIAVVAAPIIAYFVAVKICDEMRSAEGIGKRKRPIIIERSETGEYVSVETEPHPGDGHEEIEAEPGPDLHRPDAAGAGDRRRRAPRHALSRVSPPGPAGSPVATCSGERRRRCCFIAAPSRYCAGRIGVVGSIGPS